ncbi:MAG: hypothetical protein U1C46_01270 [Bacteroidales bacterium]|nr:hypothetical protein [Bacteroidales bacterium]
MPDVGEAVVDFGADLGESDDAFVAPGLGGAFGDYSHTATNEPHVARFLVSG